MERAMLRLPLACLIVYILCSCPTTYAQTCAEVLKPSKATLTEVTSLDIQRVAFDSSVEAELEFTPALAKILTTSDGTLGGLDSKFSEANKASFPKWLVRYAKYAKFNISPWKLKWDKLPYRIQKKLILELRSKYRLGAIELALKVKKELTIDFKSPTELFGKSYPAGEHTVNTEFFSNLVQLENATPTRALLELHARTNLPASINSRDTYKFFKLVGLNLTHQHIHIVGPKPKLDSIISKLEFMDFFYRANLLVELSHIYFGHGGLRSGEVHPLNTRVAGLIASNLLDKTSLIRTKSAYVGLANEKKYDQSDVIGLEYRYLNEWQNSSRNSLIQDTIQNQLVNLQYSNNNSFLPFFEYINLLVNKLGNNWKNYAFKTHYNNPYADDLINLILFNEKDSYLKHSSLELRMLTFDWAFTPYYFSDPQMLASMQKAQTKAIGLIQKYFATRSYQDLNLDSNFTAEEYKVFSKDRDFISKVMRDFIEESYLLELVAGSFGLSIEELAQP